MVDYFCFPANLGLVAVTVKKTNLKEVNFGLNTFCGPAVLSALTGRSTDECARVIAAISGHKRIDSVRVDHLTLALNKLRFKTERVNPVSSFLFGNLVSLASQPDAVYVILVPDHFIAVEVKDKKLYLIDNHTKTPLPAESSARLLQKVVVIIKAVPMPEPKLLRAWYEVRRYPNKLVITKYEAYERAEDNKSFVVGRIEIGEDESLGPIIEALEVANA